MKQMVCEVCESTELLKQEGMFVCQGCGSKYTVEEARKLLVEVEGERVAAPVAVSVVRDQGKIDNLLSLAQNAYDSKNYAQAEEFCNQILAMDDKHSEAWLLKGKAINYQIGSSNPRILEVHNCIMTAFRVLDDEQKKIKGRLYLAVLKDCMEGEVHFWLNQFEAGRPTDAALNKVKSTYSDCRSKLRLAHIEFGFENALDTYMIEFDNDFVGKCNATCNSAWKTTVGYNYYREYMGKGIDPFGRQDQRWVITDTDLYRPMKKTWDTFLSEADNLIALLQYAEKHFNDETDPKVMEAIYSNIAFFEECIIPSGSWHITQGYTSNWDQYKSVGWHEEYSLTDGAKASRRTIMNKYRALEKSAPKVAIERKRKKEQEAREARIKEYWIKHPEEKKKLDMEIELLRKELAEVQAQIAKIENKKAPFNKKLQANHKAPTSVDAQIEEKMAVIRQLETDFSKCGIFKGKLKKELRARIDEQERPKLAQLKETADAEKKARAAEIQKEIDALEAECKPLRKKEAELGEKLAALQDELTKDRT